LSFSLYGGNETEGGTGADGGVMAGDGEGSSDRKQPQIQFSVLGLFLQSVGVVLTDIQDVVFK